MQVLVLLAVVAVSQAAVLLGGASDSFRNQDNHGNYNFGYNEGHPSGGTFRRESGSHGNVAGSYGLSDADGRVRVVNYRADHTGFHADVNTNEPGVEPKDPANTLINKAGGVIASAPAVHYNTHALPYAHAHNYGYTHAHAPYYHGNAAVHYAAHPGAYSYNTAIGHHGYHGLGNHHGYHGLGHQYGYHW